MDWKHKHFQQERVFAAPLDDVREAARAFMTESLGWQITTSRGALSAGGDVRAPRETPDEFTAQGYSFTHRAIARLHFQTVAEGTRVAIELLVERAGWRGFMLFDAGGYYNLQVRKWLDGIQWTIHQKLTGSRDDSANPLVLAQNKPAAYIFNGCLMFIVVIFALYFLITFISALVGLLSGNLFLLGRGSLVIHGIWARILSAAILIFGAFVVWRIKSQRSAVSGKQ